MDKPAKKAPALRSWIRDRVVFLAFAIFVLGAAAYLGASEFIPHSSIWRDPVKEFSLLIAMIGVVSLGYELFLRELTFNEYKEALQEIVNPDAVRLGIQGIYKNRAELGQAHTFQTLFKNVKHEIFIGGTSLLSISTGSRDLLKEKVLAGINVKLLLLDPKSEVADLIGRQGEGKPTFINEIKTSILLLQKLQEEIRDHAAAHKGTLLIHTFGAIPSHSFISVDADEPHGIIIADIGPYLGRNHQRPSMLLINKKNGLYEHYFEMNRKYWEESAVLTLETAAMPGGKTRTQVFVSGHETEYFDSATETWRPAEICDVISKWQNIKGSLWVWVREKFTLEEARTGSQHTFRLQFTLPPGTAKAVKRADLLVRSDDTCHITVNDTVLKQEFGGADYPQPFIIDVSPYLVDGKNTLLFDVINYAKPDATSPEDNPGGLIYRLDLEIKE